MRLSTRNRLPGTVTEVVKGEAADRMFLHRNSMLYRLERIQKLTGLDLKDPRVALALQLGLLTLEKKEETDEVEHP